MEQTRLERPASSLPVVDLHDSIQQHVFALALQVGTLKLLLPSEAEAALKNIQEIEYLVQRVQCDLSVIRQALRIPPGTPLTRD
ncbi:MAG TPA: histidine kinase dimerization/phosphoacceptor domain-containing protein [Ktedonobacteraceae bacterium]